MTAEPTAPTPLLSAWAAELTTRSGLRLYVRPVTDEDGDMVDRFFSRLTHDDLRYRFLTPIAHPSLSLLEALVRVDHVRTEDFLAFAETNGEMELVASAMLAADPAMERAAVAIAVLPRFKGRGVGWTLLDFVARDAKTRGIKLLESVESRDNRAVIELEEEMGFSASPYPGDASLTLLRKRIAD